MESILNNILRAHPAEWALLSLFLLLFLLYAIYLVVFVLRVRLYKNSPVEPENLLSVLMTFRNEEFQLRENLPSLLDNSENGYEVIAVDNCSQDNSLAFLESLKHIYPNLKVSSLKQHTFHSGKMAQNIALKAAGHEWVTVIPPSVKMNWKEWYHEVSSRLNGKSDAVVCYSNIVPANSFFNLIFRCELFFQQLKSYGFIVNGLPFINSQNNVAFKKQQYFDEGGYRGKIHDSFANLELVINSFIRKGRVSLVLTRDSAIRLDDEVTWKDYVELLKKELNIRKHLPPVNRFLLLLFEWVHLLFAPAAVAVIIIIPEVWPFILSMVMLLVICYLFIIKNLLVRLREFKLFLPSFVIALMLPIIKMVFRILYFRYGRKKGWKIVE